MAAYAAEHEIEAVLAAAREWRDTCLLKQKSIFTGEPIWTNSNVAELDKYFVKSPDDTAESFSAKLEKQLKPASAGAKKLAAEMIWIAKLFASDLKTETKSAEVRRMWSWSGEMLPPEHRLLDKDVLIGIGGTGVGFKFNFWKEMVYFVGLLAAWNQLPPAERKRIVGDPWIFGQWLVDLPKGESRFLRHMLCFLLFPNQYERIASKNHKLSIARAFSTEVGAEAEEADSLAPIALDQRLLEIRRKVETKWPGKKLDFYYPPLRERWFEEDEVPATQIDQAAIEGAQSGSALKDDLEAILNQYNEAKKGKFSGSHPINAHFDSLRQHLADAGVKNAPLVSVDYSIGKGNWATVPWISFLDSRITNSTVSGVYAVLLFRADMSGFYLTLNQGVTKPLDELGAAKGKEFLLQTADNVRRRCPGLRAAGFALDNNIDLRVEKGLGSQYAFSTIAHKYYEKGRVPNDREFLDDIRELMRAYNQYAEQPRSKGQMTKNVPLSLIQTEFSGALRASGISFGKTHDAFTRAFIASLATKRLAILTGLSGSGKTQLALKFGEWLCPAGRWDIVPVRPDWTGPEAILGYEDALQPPISGKRVWQVPRALQLILKAVNDPDRPYLLILDEMNLAHVERYFADLLSGMESEVPCIPNLEKKGENWYAAPGSQYVAVPDNLFVVGTVNVDETTYMFSPKVLDRANTLEFRVSHDDLDGDGKKPTSCPPADEKFGFSFLAMARDVEWHRKNEPKWAGEFQSSLQRVHRILGEGNFEFGHRVYFEACRFAAIHCAAGNDSHDAALDLQIIQKMLPKLHGSRRQLESTLAALTKFCFHRDGVDEKIDLAKVEPGNARLPISFAKTRRMLENLRANQFTSFTDA